MEAWTTAPPEAQCRYRSPGDRAGADFSALQAPFGLWEDVQTHEQEVTAEEYPGGTKTRTSKEPCCIGSGWFLF